MYRLQLYRVRQSVCREKIDSLQDAVRRELEHKEARERIKPGWKVAVTVGSRGIDALPELLRCLVHWLKSRGAHPILIPAMGSHGGGTAEGQRGVLQGNGVTEANVGAPIVSSMVVESVGRTPAGTPVYVDREALAADAVVVLNRIKPHTAMDGPIQSGLLKMLAVGLGKKAGAASMHRLGLEQNVLPAARIILEKVRVAFGVAIIENAYGEPCRIAVIPPEEIEEEEKKMLQQALAILPAVPFDPLDVLIVRKMGKNISGTGMDTNVVGRWRRIGRPIDRHIGCLSVLGLTPQSRGNAYGMGMADFITKDFYRSIDFQATYANALTAGWPAGAKLPVVLEREKDLFEQLLRWYSYQKIALALIESTLQLETFWVSPALLEKGGGPSPVEVLQGPAEVGFDAQGKMALLAKRKKGPLWSADRP